MQNIGERLEEARKRKGISIREAAEVTKLRSDFIMNYEKNQFDFNLPEVYKRGFLKLYARFLNLDAEQIATDYNALQISGDKPSKGGSHESFGRMSLPSVSSAQPKADETEPVDQAGEAPLNKSLYWKVGLLMVGLLVAVFAIVTLLNVLSGPSSDPDARPETASAKGPDTTVALPSKAALPTDVQSESQIFLIAKDDVRVIVRRKKDQKNIFNDVIKKGQRIPITKKDPLQISFSDGNNLIIQKDGKQIIPAHGGPDWIELD